MNANDNNAKAPKPEDYLHIMYWGYLLGSHDYYIHGQQRLAAAANAPVNAIYEQTQGVWVTVDDIQNPIKRAQLNALVANHKKGAARG